MEHREVEMEGADLQKDPRRIALYEKKEEYNCVLDFPLSLLDPIEGPRIAAAALAVGTLAEADRLKVKPEIAVKLAGIETLIIPAVQEDMVLKYVDREWLGAAAVVVGGAFSPSECRVMIDYVEGKLTNANDVPLDLLEDPERYGLMVPAVRGTTNQRNNMRVVAMAPQVAELLYQRVLPFLRKLDQEKITIDAANSHLFEDQGAFVHGSWRATGINPCFRLCKYNPDGHFAPHCDSHFSRDYNCRSLKTFMIYLNDEYDLGTTNFLESHQLHFDESTARYKAPRSAVRARLKANTGDILIFDHNLLHEGETVENGVKYIMRAEVMYSRATAEKQLSPDATEEEKALAKAKAEDQVRMEKGYFLLKEAASLEDQHDFDGAVQKYRAAFKLAPELEKLA